MRLFHPTSSKSTWSEPRWTSCTTLSSRCGPKPPHSPLRMPRVSARWQCSTKSATSRTTSTTSGASSGTSSALQGGTLPAAVHERCCDARVHFCPLSASAEIVPRLARAAASQDPHRDGHVRAALWHPQLITTCIHVGWHLVPQIKHARARTTSDPSASLIVRSAAHGTPKKKVAPLAGVVQPTSHPHNPCKRRHSLVARAHRQYEPALPTQRPRE